MNVSVTDVAIQVPVAIAANVCDVNVNVLATQERLGGAQCTADADSEATAGPGDGGNQPGQGGTTQDGLVNVNLDDIAVQIPIAVAANICDVNVGVLAQQLRVGNTDCDADGVAIARIPGQGGGGGA